MKVRLFLNLIVAGLLAACGSAPPLNPPARGPQRPAPPPASPVDITADAPVAGSLSPEQSADVTLYAISLVGTPYRWGGNTPESGFDCSGLIGHVYASRAALKLPRTTAELAFVGRSVADAEARTGDLVLFGPGLLPNHAGIVVGQGRFVHAPSTGGTVRLERLDSPHWRKQQPRFRRP